MPRTLLKQKLWARVTARTIEIFHQGQRVASHVRTSANRQHTTVAKHMPASHRRYAGWTPAEIRRQAARIGPNTGALVDLILSTKTHPEQGFRACLGIVRLLIDREAASRSTRKFQSRMRAAKLRHVGASSEDVDFRTPRKLDRALFQQLASGRWIDAHQNLLITGPCGAGKTWLAVRHGP